MSADPYAAIGSEIRSSFPADQGVIRRDLPSGEVLFYIAGVPSPAGCQPGAIRVLLRYRSPAQPPDVFFNPVPSLANGSPTPNQQPTQIEGEVWSGFSVKWAWDASDSIWGNVRRKLMRCASAS
jgi:hypothetical protein